MVLVHDEHLAVVVVFNPVVVLVVEPLEVQLVDVHLVFAAPLADLRGERRHARLEVDQQVGLGNERRDEPENAHVGLDVARGHQPHLVKVAREDVRVLVDRAVLDDVALRDVGEHLHRLPDAASEEIDLQVERPAVHVLVKIADIGVVALLEVGPRVVTRREHLGQRGLPAADISGYGYIHNDPCFNPVSLSAPRPARARRPPRGGRSPAAGPCSCPAHASIAGNSHGEPSRCAAVRASCGAWRRSPN